jgi:hypothetical protein
MPTAVTSKRNRKVELRQMICDALTEPEYLGMTSVEISEALMECAFAWRDYGGGIDDTCHAAKSLHQFVDREGARRRRDYSPEKLRNYLTRTRQL